MVKKIVFNYLSMKTYGKRKKNYVIYIYKLFFEINPNTLSTGVGVGAGAGVVVAVGGYN